jgi:hypothetical protein
LLGYCKFVADRCAGIPGISEVPVLYDVVVTPGFPGENGPQRAQSSETPGIARGVARQLWQSPQQERNKSATDKIRTPAIPGVSGRVSAIGAQQERNRGELLLRSPPQRGSATSPATTAQRERSKTPSEGSRGGSGDGRRTVPAADTQGQRRHIEHEHDPRPRPAPGPPPKRSRPSTAPHGAGSTRARM